MEGAQREREITYVYLKRAQYRLTEVTQDYTNVQEIVDANKIFIECLQRFENAQHEYERILPDSLLQAECMKASDIRARFSDFTNYIDDFIRQKTSLNPFANASRNTAPSNSTNSTSFEVSSDIYSVVTGPEPNVNVNNAATVAVSTPQNIVNNDPWQAILNQNQNIANNDPWQPIQNHNQNTIRQNLNFATPVNTQTQNLTSTGIITGNLPTLDSSIIHIPTSNVNLPVMNANNLPPVNSKLDKVKLKIFHGAHEEWQSFWETFESLVHNTNLPVINKFTYLRNSLRGEAYKVINGYALTSANYEHAIRHLKKRFGRSDRIIQSHILSLLGDISVKISYSSNRTKYIAALWNFYDTILVHIRSLEALGIQGSSVEIFLCPIILSKLPEDLRLV